jgi:hypothetical protein
MTTVLDQQSAGQAAAGLFSTGGGGDGNDPPRAPFGKVGYVHEEERAAERKC